MPLSIRVPSLITPVHCITQTEEPIKLKPPTYIYQMRSSGIRAISIQKPFPTFAVIVSGGGAMIPLYSKEGRHLSLLETKRLIFLFLAPLLLNNFLTLSISQ